MPTFVPLGPFSCPGWEGVWRTCPPMPLPPIPTAHDTAPFLGVALVLFAIAWMIASLLLLYLGMRD